MSRPPTVVYELIKVTDHPTYEGFGLASAPSFLGRDDLMEDVVGGYEAADGVREWSPVHLAELWKPMPVAGRVTPFNDFPCVNLFIPAFSDRAREALRDLLEPHGELLPLVARQGVYWLYNVTTVVDGLDPATSTCEFWSDPPTTAVDIERFGFHDRVVRDLPIFRVYEAPTTTLVTEPFRQRVDEAGLMGFQFHRLWPLPDGTSWRELAKETRRSQAPRC